MMQSQNQIKPVGESSRRSQTCLRREPGLDDARHTFATVAGCGQAKFREAVTRSEFSVVPEEAADFLADRSRTARSSDEMFEQAPVPLCRAFIRHFQDCGDEGQRSLSDMLCTTPSLAHDESQVFEKMEVATLVNPAVSLCDARESVASISHQSPYMLDFLGSEAGRDCISPGRFALFSCDEVETAEPGVCSSDRTNEDDDDRIALALKEEPDAIGNEDEFLPASPRRSGRMGSFPDFEAAVEATRDALSSESARMPDTAQRTPGCQDCFREPSRLSLAPAAPSARVNTEGTPTRCALSATLAVTDVDVVLTRIFFIVLTSFSRVSTCYVRSVSQNGRFVKQ